METISPSERFYRLNRHHYRPHKHITYTQDEINEAISYLTNPIKNGIWRLEGKWLFDKGISALVKSEIKSKYKTLTTPNKKNIKISETELEELLSRTERISFILALLKYLRDRNESSESLEEYTRADNQDNLIFTLLDFDLISQEYQEAIYYFNENIYFDGLITAIGNMPTKIKNGSFLTPIGPGQVELRSKRSMYFEADEIGTKVGSKKIQLQATSAIPLEQIGWLLNKVGKIDTFDIFAIFSPEEELLSPYAEIAQTMAPYVLSSDGDHQLLKKMLSDYRSDNFVGCISTAGLIAEECLTQIYETLYRSPVPERMMLGTLREKIGEIVRSSSSSAKSPSRQPQSKQDLISLLKGRKSNNKEASALIASAAGTIIEYVELHSKKLEKRISSLEGQENDQSIFPTIIKLNLSNLTRFRNAVSHKSSDPIGSFEGLKSIYCSLSLIMWWDNQKKKINWHDDQKGIIQQFIKAAPTYK